MQPQKLTPPDGATNPQETARLIRDITDPAHDVYALRVKGDAMIDADIFDGDIVLLRRATVCANGDMVAVRIRGVELTLKRWHDEGQFIRLQPENRVYEPLYYAPSDVAVEGHVIATIHPDVDKLQFGQKPKPAQPTKAAPSPPHPAWQRTSQPQGTQRILEDGVTHATGAAGERVTRKRGRGVSALGRE